MKRINQLNSVNALTPLSGLQSAMLGTNCILSDFKSNESNVGSFQITDCDEENSNKIKNILSKQSLSFKVKSIRNNSIEGTF